MGGSTIATHVVQVHDVEGAEQFAAPPGQRIADGGVVEVVLRVNLDYPAIRQLDLNCTGFAPIRVLQLSARA